MAQTDERLRLDPMDSPPGAPGASAWERVQLARHPGRPYTLDYIHALFDGFVELHGDRLFADDAALVGGPARFGDRTVMVIGHQKGRDTKDNARRRFGMPQPEGYRKALRLMKQAEKFGFPVISFVDTPGADPTLPSEERGQALAIATNLLEMSRLRTPTVSIIIGEGGSGGALAIALSDRVLMLENAIYSVVTPEGCASILWKNASLAPDAAASMRITAEDIWKFGIVDGVIPEPQGGAHTDHAATADALARQLSETLEQIDRLYGRAGALDTERLLRDRHDRYRGIGVYHEA
ncbi:MAG: acetyl-CoA carboxylase carboxyltransferase subunit alpha [Chloroflexota bacterium]